MDLATVGVFVEPILIGAVAVATTLRVRQRRLRALELELEDAKRRLLDSVSHELRTPLTSIKGYAELLRARRLGPLTERQERALEVLGRAVRREEALVENLLHVARFAAGGYRIEPETLDLRDAAAATREALLGLAARREVRLELVLPEEAALVSADRRGIEVVLAHLVENALKFTPRGGRVELAVARGDAAASVSVSDTGSGVPLEARRRVFEPFSPAAGAAREHAGAGLGLPIVKGILAAHGVPIEAVERPGGGALFRFALPLVRIATTRA